MLNTGCAGGVVIAMSYLEADRRGAGAAESVVKYVERRAAISANVIQTYLYQRISRNIPSATIARKAPSTAMRIG